MNKKGFTLVELLAVIAILAILVIIALPNVIKLYNNAKKNTFLTEAKTIYKEAANKYITESMKGNKVSYINSNNKYTSSLDLNSDKDLQYCINLDNSGNVVNMSVLNNEYYLEYSNDKDITKYNIENVKDKNDKTKMLCSKTNNKIIQMPDKKECKSDSDDTYSDGTYTYTKSGKGWSVKLTDLESTDPVTETPCSVINGKPIVSTGGMFMNSKATSIDLSNFDTSNVTDMEYMFYAAQATEIKGLEYLDTSKVTDMSDMFNRTFRNKDDTQKVILDLSSFDTKNVIYMHNMFDSSQANEINVSSFDTNNVIKMYSMFSGTTEIRSLDLSSFNTKNVDNMNNMFINSRAEIVYTRNDEELNKYKSSGNVPVQIKFINKNSK